MSRRFTKRQRTALYLSSDGCCTLCGIELTIGWHADHEYPWSRGGLTDVVNGQALCPSCNQRKGIIMVGQDNLREWQQIAREKYHDKNKDNWLLYACTGSGKTMWTLTVMKDLLRSGTVKRWTVVASSDHSRSQWKMSASLFGIELAIVDNDAGGRENRADPFQGNIVTYAQVASAPDVHRRYCGKEDTGVVFDECHHCGDDKSWGEKVLRAFEPAKRRILLTGTPWRRSSSSKIPFVEYGEDGIVRPDYIYTYGMAVRHGVCRNVTFRAYDGSVHYVVIGAADEQRIEVLGLDEDDQSHVLRDILRPSGKWMQDVMSMAMGELEEMRRGDSECVPVPDAQGIVTMSTKSDAKEMVRKMKQLGESPALIISNPEQGEPNPKNELERFRRGMCKWAVAVDIMGESIDIPSIHVVVYATNKKTVLTFQQRVGRALRMRQGDTREAVVFMPAVQSLKDNAAEIERELLYSYEEAEEQEPDENDGDAVMQDGIDEAVIGRIMAGTSAAVFDMAITNGQRYSSEEMRYAEELATRHGLTRSAIVSIAALVREIGGGTQTNATHASTSAEQIIVPAQDQKELLKRDLSTRIGTWARVIAQNRGVANGEAIGQVKRGINGFMMRNYGQRNDMSMEQLRNAIRLVTRWTSEGRDYEFA